MNSDVPTTYLRDRNNTRWTFGDRLVRAWVQEQIGDAERILNLCAGKTHLPLPDAEVVRVDLDEERDADLHIDAVDVADHFEPDSFDAIVCDPPWQDGEYPMIEHQRPKHDRYDRHVDNYTKLKQGIAKVLDQRGVSILFGYNSSGLGKGRDFRPDAILLVNYTGSHRDVTAVAERRINCQLDPDWGGSGG